MRLVGNINKYNERQVIIDIDGDSKTTDKLSEFGDELVVFDIKKYRDKRSLSANNYLWYLINQISMSIKADRESVYHYLLKQAGVMVTLQVIEDAVPMLLKTFRVVEEIGRSGDLIDVNCYYGSSLYDTKEMSRLIEYAHQCADELGCDVWDKEEIKRLWQR